MIEKLESIDTQLFLWLNGLHADWLDMPMYYMSEGLFWIPVYLLILWMVAKAHGWKVALLSLLGVALVITMTDRGSVELFKEVFQRYRPSRNADIAHLVHTVNDYRGGKYGFISSHASNYFGVATFIFLMVRKTFVKSAFLLFVWAALIAYTRIYLGVHYPSDIFVGAVFGSLCGWIGYIVFKKAVLERVAGKSTHGPSDPHGGN